MGAWVGSRSPGDIESGDGVLNEIDHALAALGTAHWMENSRTDAYRRYRRQSTSIKWQQLWGNSPRSDHGPWWPLPPKAAVQGTAPRTGGHQKVRAPRCTPV